MVQLNNDLWHPKHENLKGNLHQTKVNWRMVKQGLSPKCKFRGSKFSRIVPENKNESCGTSAIRDRIILNGKVAISTVSMVIRPACSGAIRRRAAIRDDLPAPVRPTIPILSQDDVWNVIF